MKQRELPDLLKACTDVKKKIVLPLFKVIYVTQSNLVFFNRYSACDQVKHTPAKLRTTKDIVKNEDLVESTTCVVM